MGGGRVGGREGGERKEEVEKEGRFFDVINNFQ